MPSDDVVCSSLYFDKQYSPSKVDFKELFDLVARRWVVVLGVHCIACDPCDYHWGYNNRCAFRCEEAERGAWSLRLVNGLVAFRATEVRTEKARHLSNHGDGFTASSTITFRMAEER